MQRQIYMLNLFVEFRFQLFHMKTLFDFKLRISAGMIDNPKTRNITLVPATLRSTKMFKNVGIFVLKEMLINTCVKIPKIPKKLKKNKDIIILRPNKGNCVVVLDKVAYNNALSDLLSDDTKFKKLQSDLTLRREGQLQR